MMKRRRWSRLVLLVGAVGLAWGLLAAVQAWWIRHQVARARAEIAAVQIGPARERLSALATAHPGALGGTVDYLLGISEAMAGRNDAALAAFRRLPAAFEFDPDGAALEARANLEFGRLHAAESRLERCWAGGGPGRDRLIPWLIHVYERQVRFDDVARLLYSRLDEETRSNKILRLRDLENLKLGRHPYELLRANLDKIGRKAPDDDRVWLGAAAWRSHWDGGTRPPTGCGGARRPAPTRRCGGHGWNGRGRRTAGGGRPGPGPPRRG